MGQSVERGLQELGWFCRTTAAPRNLILRLSQEAAT